VAALSLEEKGFVLGAALARTTPDDAAARVPGPGGARCAAALAALADEPRGARAAALAGLTALVRAPVPAGIERVHPDWLRERLEAETSAVVRAVTAQLPDAADAADAAEAVRRIAAGVLSARGEEARGPTPDAGAPGVQALQRAVFAGLVPLAGPGAPATPMARELAALEPGELRRAIEVRGAEALGRSLRGAPDALIARAAAAVGGALATVVMEAADGDGQDAARERARALVAAAGAPDAADAAFAIGVHALADALTSEGEAALAAVAQRLPPAQGRLLLAAADGEE